MQMKPPEKRKAVLYVRVRPATKKMIKTYAKVNDVSESHAVDFLLELAMKAVEVTNLTSRDLHP